MVRFLGIVAMSGSLLVGLGGCAASEKPAGIGYGVDDYKESPCACNEIKQRVPPGLEDDLRAMGLIS